MHILRCPRCGNLQRGAEAVDVCGRCGALSVFERVDSSGHVPTQGPSRGRAITALVVNVAFLPGLGSMIGGQGATGGLQLLLGLLSSILLFVTVHWQVVLVAYVGALGVWVWALVTGIRLVQAAPPAIATGPNVPPPDAP